MPNSQEKILGFKVAGHYFEFVLPQSFPTGRLFAQYEPFAAESQQSDCVFRLRIEVADALPPTGKLLKRCNTEAPYLWIYEDGRQPQDKCFGHSLTPDAPASILRREVALTEGETIADDMPSAILTIVRHCPIGEAEIAVNNSAMLLYAWNTGRLDTLMLHASAPMRGGFGYIFLGKSGTGKSTHSRMWLENLEGCELLNDDNPVVRIVDGKAMLYGSPWSGKTPCYRNLSVPLAGIVRIVRAPHNNAVRLAPLQSFASLTAACSTIIWDRNWKNAQEDCIEKVIGLVPGWNMECLPDADAAFVCSEAVEPKNQ